MRSEPANGQLSGPAFALRATRASSSLEDQFMALRNRELHARNDDDKLQISRSYLRQSGVNSLVSSLGVRCLYCVSIPKSQHVRYYMRNPKSQ